MIKGQLMRLFVNNKAWAAATSGTFHVSLQMEDCSTKDTEGNWVDNEPTGISWDASTDCLVLTDEDSANNLDFALQKVGDGETYMFELASTTGAAGTKNRTPSSPYAQGNVHISEVSITAANRQNSTFTVSMIGDGQLSTGTIVTS